MIGRALGISNFVVMAAMAAQPASAAPWVRGYVVGFYEFAFHYGGRSDYERGAEIQPGIDCPHGSTVHFANPTEAAKAFSLQSWRSKQQVEAIANPPDTGDSRAQAGLYYYVYHANSNFRGYRPDIQTFVNPFAADDPGEFEVTSRIGEGFNLDGKIKPADFVSPDGEAGIDNGLYRAWGCDAAWRGNGNATMTLRANDKMQEGLFTVVVRLSGNGDPRNDDAATLEIGYSPDKIMKDARGNTGADYSYRILKGPQYTKLKARIKDGVVETEQADIHMPEIAWFPNQNRDADFHQGKIRLVLHSDDTAEGLVGGYRDWRALYAQHTFAQSGATQAVREHEDPVALYYAMRREADGMFNPKTGRYDGISTAYRLRLAEAFVVDPERPMSIPPPPAGGLGGKKAYDETMAAMIKATATLIPQPFPPGSGEDPGGRADEQKARQVEAAKLKAGIQ
jgi:hypothetical protein